MNTCYRACLIVKKRKTPKCEFHNWPTNETTLGKKIFLAKNERRIWFPVILPKRQFPENNSLPTCCSSVAQLIEHPLKGPGSVQLYWHGFESHQWHKKVGKNDSPKLGKQSFGNIFGILSFRTSVFSPKNTWLLLPIKFSSPAFSTKRPLFGFWFDSFLTRADISERETELFCGIRPTNPTTIVNYKALWPWRSAVRTRY